MYRVSQRLAHAVVGLISTSLLLSGCVAGPTGLGAGMPRSIKDAPEPSPVAAAPSTRAVKAPTKIAVLKPPPVRPKPPAKAEPKAPTCATGSACMVRLKAMIDNPDRSWIGKPQPPAEFANGTRLFAYRALRPQLTCPQLTAALDEIRSAGKAFATPVAGVTAEQARRVLALNADVERELQTELTIRCKS